jgi:hypothetical protein
MDLIREIGSIERPTLVEFAESWEVYSVGKAVAVYRGRVNSANKGNWQWTEAANKGKESV